MAKGSPWRRRPAAAGLFVLIAAACAWPASAFADDSGGAGGGGAAPPASTRSAPSVPDAVRPAGTSVSCRTKCTQIGVKPGGSARIVGTNMSRVNQVVFLGGSGAGDNVGVKASHVRDDRVDFRVPSNAPSGRLRLVTKTNVLSRSNTRISLVVDGGDGGSDAPLPPVTLPGLIAQVQTRRVFFDGAKPASLTFVLTGATAQDVRVDVESVATGVSVVNKVLYAVPPRVPQAVSWNGVASAGAVSPDGHYHFRITVGPQPPPSAGARATKASAPPPGAADAGAFALLGATFPVRGKHNYGGSSARYGAGRTGHVHQGQDVLAACGTPLVAARGGKVLWRASQSLAGNYLVIQTDGSKGASNVYMHLREPAMVKKGQHVATGQLIGYVGDTGDATACHLHFEYWTAPGWYLGGHATDPLPYLLAWDAVS